VVNLFLHSNSVRNHAVLEGMDSKLRCVALRRSMDIPIDMCCPSMIRFRVTRRSVAVGLLHAVRGNTIPSNRRERAVSNVVRHVASITVFRAGYLFRRPYPPNEALCSHELSVFLPLLSVLLNATICLTRTKAQGPIAKYDIASASDSRCYHSTH
jgi:hypothetical protein